MGKNLLAIGHALGHENISKLQNLRRHIRSGKPGVYSTRFELTSSSVDEFVSLVTEKSAKKVSIAHMLRSILPKSTVEQAKNIIDVNFKRSGTVEFPGSTFLTVKGVTNLEHDIVNSGEVKLVKNKAGTMLSVSGKGEGQTHVALDSYLLSKGNGNFDSAVLMKSANYSNDGSRGNLSMNMPQNGVFKFLRGSIDAQVTILDSLTKVFTKGRFSSFGDLFKSLKG